MRTLLAVALLLTLTVRPASAGGELVCDMKRGPEGVSLGVAYYFRDVMQDAIDILETGRDGSVEVNSDWLCSAPRSAQPIMIATAEHVLYLIFEVIPVMAGMKGI